MTFRPIQAEDLASILSIEQRIYSHPWALHRFQQCVRQKACGCFLLENSHGIQAYGIVKSTASQNQAEILNLSVKTTQQGQGLGRKMLQYLLQHSQQAATVFLEVRQSNHIAIALYQSCGFNLISVQPNYYPQQGRQREDALLLAKVQFQ